MLSSSQSYRLSKLVCLKSKVDVRDERFHEKNGLNICNSLFSILLNDKINSFDKKKLIRARRPDEYILSFGWIDTFLYPSMKEHFAYFSPIVFENIKVLSEFALNHFGIETYTNMLGETGGDYASIFFSYDRECTFTMMYKNGKKMIIDIPKYFLLKSDVFDIEKILKKFENAVDQFECDICMKSYIRESIDIAFCGRCSEYSDLKCMFLSHMKCPFCRFDVFPELLENTIMFISSCMSSSYERFEVLFTETEIINVRDVFV